MHAFQGFFRNDCRPFALHIRGEIAPQRRIGQEALLRLVEAADVLGIGDRDLQCRAVARERDRADALEHRQRDRLRRDRVDARDREVDEREAVFLCEAARDAEKTALDRERIRLWYVAATRARELLVLPRLDVGAKGSAWISLLDLALHELPAPSLSHAIERDRALRRRREKPVGVKLWRR